MKTETKSAAKPAAAKKPASKPVVRITDTTLRDAHQSLWATRMRTEDILPILDAVDAAGYYSLECWGGATFDVCLRFLRENPWERLRLLKARCKTPLQMLLRGQNILGYKHYPDDVLKRFIELSALNGIDIFRVFDALNDTRNLEFAIKTVKAVGAHAQGTISYTFSPVHTDAAYVKLAREMEQIGADSICIKDMAGILSPGEAARLVAALVKEVSIPVQLHGHMTSGMMVASYVAGVQAGAGAVDACVASMSGCSSQPPMQTLEAIFSSLGYDTKLDVEAVQKENLYFKELAPKREPLKPSRLFVDVGVLRHHIPGGMISNLRSQLQQQGALDRLDEVLEELPRVRKDKGYPPLVTPTSQIIGIQSVLNVLTGKRYGNVTQETTNYVKGLYGRTPAPIDPKVAKKILKGEKPITCRPADLLEPGLADAAAKLDPKYVQAEEDILSYCLFPDVALGYFKWRALPPDQRPPIPADVERQQPKAEEAKPAPVADEATLRYAAVGRAIAAALAGLGGTVPAELPPLPAAATSAPATDAVPAATVDATPAGDPILAPLNGTFYRRPRDGEPDYAKEGDEVAAGAPVCAVEAMKLMNAINAPKRCKVVKFLVQHGENVTKGQTLAIVQPL